MDENTYCNICKSFNHKILFTKGSLELIKCLDCGSVQVSNLEHVFDIKSYEYYKERLQLDKTELYNSITSKRYFNLLKEFEFARMNNRLLDIGCGEGHFLYEAKKMGWQVKGIEKSPYAVTICRKFNLEVADSDFLDLELDSNQFDIITMIEVIEHLVQPWEYLCKIKSILREGGLLYLTTPNFNCLTRYLFGSKWSKINKEHLFYFSPPILKNLILQCNFKILYFRSKHINIQEISNMYKRNNVYDYQNIQNLRELIEDNKLLLFLKNSTNKILNFYKLGETIECLCQKI